MNGKRVGTVAQERMITQIVAAVAPKIIFMGHARRRKRVAANTARAKLQAFERYVRVLVIDLKKFFKSADSLGERHYREYAQYLMARGLSNGSYGNAHSQIRDIYCRVLHKDCIGPTSEYYGNLAERSLTCTSSKAWDDIELRTQDGNVLTPEMVRERVRQRGQGDYLVLELCHLLGLRIKEAALLRPHHDLCVTHAATDGLLTVRDANSKNGRARELDLSLLPAADRTRLMEVWQECCSWVTHVDGTLLNPRALSLSWDRQRSRLYYRLGCAGLTKRDLGVTAHGLRHGFLQRSQEYLSGQPVPLHGLLSQDASLFRLLNARNSVARLVTSESAGHSRDSVTAAYYGSPYKQFLASGGSKKEWDESHKWVRDIERGDVERLQKRLLALQQDDIDLDALRNEITENVRLVRPLFAYGRR